MRAIVVGAGVFGATAALELASRGWAVTLLEQGQPPHPDAASTDISKLVRADYGTDRFYVDLVGRAIAGWEAWNARAGRPLYRADGLLVLASRWERGRFERDAFETLVDVGRAPDRLDAAVIRRRFSQWRGGWQGYLNPRAGWAASGEAVGQVVAWCREAGVEVREDAGVVEVMDDAAVRIGSGTLAGDVVVVAAGAWTGALVPEAASLLRSVGQPVFHLRPDDPTPWRAPTHRPWCADIGGSGWYGFPATADGVVKIANHGAGAPTDPRGPRAVDPRWGARLRAFLRENLPGLADAPIAGTRLCLYTDTPDGDLLVDRVPGRRGVVVASGGSGHGFKLAPVLGGVVADAVEGRVEPRFGWREARRGSEAARSAVRLADES